MKVLHISPTYFHQDSIIGGGERYVFELCKEMASKGIQTSLLSFGKENKKFIQDDVKYFIEVPLSNMRGSVLNPIPFPRIKLIKDADIIHCHQYFNILTEAYLLLAYLLNKPIVVTDHGGGGVTILHRLGVEYLVNKFLCVSHYSKSALNLSKDIGEVIYGGADVNHFKHNGVNRIKNKLISTGRILPHKGHHHIIKSLSIDEQLIIVGRYNENDEYFNYLKEIAKGKNVTFKQNLKDSELLDEICSSSLAIFPSTNISPDGKLLSGEPELFGLAPVEIMATGTPVIVSNIGSYPEIALSHEYVFQHGDTLSLRKKIDQIYQKTLDEKSFVNHVHQQFTWEHVCQKCIEIYKKVI